MTLREYLLSTSLLVENPYHQQHLLPLERLNNPDITPKLINGYSVSSEKIFCHICGSRRHNKGITAQLSDGSLMLFGRNCAEGFFGHNIWDKCWGEFKRKQTLAFARYRILNIGQLCKPMKSWIASYRQMALRSKDAWDKIQANHPQFFDELQYELRRNNGRITEVDDFVADENLAALGLKSSFSKTTIVTLIRSAEFIVHVNDIDKDLIVVESFLTAIENLGADLSDQQIIEYSRRVDKNVRSSSQRIDGVISLTAEILSDKKLQLVGSWSDRKRIRALRERSVVTPRDIAETVRRTCGYGYEAPPFKLEDTIPNLRRSVEELGLEKKSISIPLR